MGKKNKKNIAQFHRVKVEHRLSDFKEEDKLYNLNVSPVARSCWRAKALQEIIAAEDKRVFDELIRIAEEAERGKRK